MPVRTKHSRPQRKKKAARSPSTHHYLARASDGYSRMYVHNATHLFWQQVMTDNGEPQEEGKVIDYFWLVQDKHGPFTGL